MLLSDTASRFVGFGAKAGTTSKTHLKLRALSFSFLSQRGAADRLWRLGSAENALLKLDRSLARKQPAAIVSESTQVACRLIRKTPVRRPVLSTSKVSSLKWLAYELTNGF